MPLPMPQLPPPVQRDALHQAQLDMQRRLDEAQATHRLHMEQYNQRIGQLNRNAGLMGTYQEYAAQRAALVVGQQPTRTVTIGQVDSYLFWRIPSVAYAVEKIPAFKVLSPSGILAAYFAEAKRDGLPLRQQCNDLGIPWAARLIPLAHVSEASVKAAGVLSPSVFSQTLPQSDVETWARHIVYLYEHGASESVLKWVAARHAVWRARVAIRARFASRNRPHADMALRVE